MLVTINTDGSIIEIASVSELFPNTMMPEGAPLSDYGVYEVVDNPPPTTNRYQYYENTGNISIVNGVPSFEYVVKDRPLEDIRVLVKHDIDNSFNSAVRALTESINSNEIASWTKQEVEAKAFVNDSTTSTPLIDALAASRRVSKEYLVPKILQKAAAYSAVIGAYVGKAQRLKDLADTATDIETLKLIKWDEAQ